MTNEQLDAMWDTALLEALEAGEMFARYRFAALVAAAEREECAKVCLSLFDCDDDSCNEAEQCAAAIRERKQP